MRRSPSHADGGAPTFEDYVTARRVMIHVRKWLEEQGEHVTLSECPIFSHIVLQSSPVCDPKLFESSQLASAEGSYIRTDSDAYAMRHGGGE
jgi:hypothetical protein